MGCEAQLALKMPIHAHFFQRAILTRKVPQTDWFLAGNLGSLGSMHARLQVSVFSGCDLFNPR